LSPTFSHFIKTKTQSYFITISRGLEFVAEEEIQEKLQPSVIKSSANNGKVFFATDKSIKEILKLRAADNLYAFVGELSGVPSDPSGLQFLQKVPLMEQMDWESALVRP
jgi:23S rRNA G2445 N2-methylase RlmL